MTSSLPTLLHNGSAPTSTPAQSPHHDYLTTFVPQKFAVVPDLGDNSGPNWRPNVCLLALCEGLSITNQSDGSLHVVDVTGYTIKCPRTFEHRHRVRVKYLTTMLEYGVVALEFAASFGINLSSRPGDVAISALESTRKIADNKELLNRAGITADSLFTVQNVTDPHQVRAVKGLLQGADRHGKDNITGDLEYLVHECRSLWVCNGCSADIRNGRVIDETRNMKWSQYISLVKREPRNEVTLDDADSVTLLTKSLSKFSNITTRLTIHVNSEYFEASDRANGARFKAIRHLFQELGQVLNRQKKLTHLKIHADSTRGQVYSGLRAVLKSRTLKSLCISGIPCFFQSADIPIKCRELEELSLHGVYLNDEQSARHLWRLVEVNSGLVKLKMAGVSLTAAVLSMSMTEATLTQLRKIESLDLSSNDLGEQEVTRFVGMALGSDHPRLRQLDLSGNTRLGDEGCQRVIGLLMGRSCWLEGLEVKNAGLNPRTIESVRTYLSRSRRVYPV